MPGGPIEPDAFTTLLAHIRTGLKRHIAAGGALDGVYLDLHGAMFATGVQDAEGEIVKLVREEVGTNAVLSASFDLHGNFSAAMAAGLDLTTAYRTAPHIDIVETQLKAVAMLAATLRRCFGLPSDAVTGSGGGSGGGSRPHLAYVPIPLGISGEMSNTADEPTRTLYSSVLHEADGADGVLDASILVGYVWADEPRTGASVLVTGTNKEVAQAEATRIAQAIWSARAGFKFGVPAADMRSTILAAVDAAKERTGSNGPNGSDATVLPVIISDSGDNPTAGGVGDTPSMLKELVALGVGDVVMQGPHDAAAVRACIAAGVGGEVQLDLGGKLDYRNAEPVTTWQSLAPLSRPSGCARAPCCVYVALRSTCTR